LQAFVSHILECNPQHITVSLLKEYLNVLPLAAVEVAAVHHFSARLPRADLLCLPLTTLIQAPSAVQTHEFERKMLKRCGGDFNRNLAGIFPAQGKASKKNIFCECRWSNTPSVSFLPVSMPLFVLPRQLSSLLVSMSLFVLSRQIFRCAIMSIKTEKSGGGSARTRELYDLFGRSALYLGCGEVPSGFNWIFSDFLSSSKRKNSTGQLRYLGSALLH
jgi:hypothetical protein